MSICNNNTARTMETKYANNNKQPIDIYRDFAKTEAFAFKFIYQMAYSAI